MPLYNPPSSITGVGTLTSGAINWAGAISTSGVMTVSNTTDAASSLTGASLVAGGLGVAKNIWGGATVGCIGGQGQFLISRRDNNATAYILYSAAGTLSFYDGTADRLTLANGGLLTATHLTVASAGVLKLGNAATTGLTAGVLAALTNATIVISDSTGQAYRIPCII